MTTPPSVGVLAGSTGHAHKPHVLPRSPTPVSQLLQAPGLKRKAAHRVTEHTTKLHVGRVQGTKQSARLLNSSHWRLWDCCCQTQEVEGINRENYVFLSLKPRKGEEAQKRQNCYMSWVNSFCKDRQKNIQLAHSFKSPQDSGSFAGLNVRTDLDCAGSSSLSPQPLYIS